MPFKVESPRVTLPTAAFASGKVNVLERDEPAAAAPLPDDEPEEKADRPNAGSPPTLPSIQAKMGVFTGLDTGHFRAIEVRPRSNAMAVPVARVVPAVPMAIPVAAPVAVASTAAPAPAGTGGFMQTIGRFFGGIGKALRTAAVHRAQVRAAKMSPQQVSAHINKAAPRLVGLNAAQQYEAVRNDPVLWRGLEAQCAKEYSTDQLDVMKAGQKFADNPRAGWADYKALMKVVEESTPNISSQLRGKLDSVTEATFGPASRALVGELNAEMSGLLVKDPIKRMLTQAR